MFSETLKRGLLAHLIKFRFTITVITCLLFVITTTLTGDDSDNQLDRQTDDPFEILCQLPHPHKVERQISWGYVGAYGTSRDDMTKRVAFWRDSTDNFLSNAPDTEIAEFASIFTSRTVIAVLRELVDGKKSVADLAKACGISESEVEKAVDTLMKATLAVRTEDNIIRPHNDAISFFLNFVSMTTVHLGHTKSDR